MFAVSSTQTRLPFEIRQLLALRLSALDALLFLAGVGYICAFLGTGILRAGAVPIGTGLPNVVGERSPGWPRSVPPN